MISLAERLARMRFEKYTQRSRLTTWVREATRVVMLG